MKKKIISSIDIILVGVLIIIINNVIGIFDWHLKSEFIGLALTMITIGVFLLGVLFLLKEVKSKGIKIFSIMFWFIVIFFCFVLLCLSIKITIIKEIDGVKYCGVEYISNRLRKEVFYYKEYNIFAYHKTKEYIEEFYDYNDYINPEFREYHKENLKDSIIYYYDKEGNITNIGTYDDTGKIIKGQ